MKEQVVHDGFLQVAIIQTALGPREVIRATDSVNLLIFNKETRQIVLLSEPRTGMRAPDNPNGISTGSIAGRFDVDLTPEKLMVKEAEEEAGVTLAPEDITMLNNGQPMILSAGVLTEKAYLGIAIIDDSMIEQEERVFGADDEGESIRRVYIDLADLEDYVCESVRVFAMIQYFLRNFNGKEIDHER
jgi:8-oxo-dGTP pyrophosphatase MutT (NUDIX family)